jgi:hypothetical protein
MSASCLIAQDINSVMNSDQVSRNLDEHKGLNNFVRLSLNDKNPMQYVALKEKRVANLVMLKVNLQVVSRPGVLFSDCNATRTDAVRSSNPKVIRYDIVQQKDQFAVAPELKKFYQAEVLVPSPIPPHLIVFPQEALPASTVPQGKNGKDVPVLLEAGPAVYYDCRYMYGEWFCECGSPRCVPRSTGSSSFGATGLTPPRARDIEQGTKDTNGKNVSGTP